MSSIQLPPGVTMKQCGDCKQPVFEIQGKFATKKDGTVLAWLQKYDDVQGNAEHWRNCPVKKAKYIAQQAAQQTTAQTTTVAAANMAANNLAQSGGAPKKLQECNRCKANGVPNQQIGFENKGEDPNTHRVLWRVVNPDGTEHQHKTTGQQTLPQPPTIDESKSTAEGIHANGTGINQNAQAFFTKLSELTSDVGKINGQLETLTQWIAAIAEGSGIELPIGPQPAADIMKSVSVTTEQEVKQEPSTTST